jgi:hypothetical protein
MIRKLINLCPQFFFDDPPQGIRVICPRCMIMVVTIHEPPPFRYVMPHTAVGQ